MKQHTLPKMTFSKKNTVWKFTNGIELNEKEFTNYLERKVFKTIRKYGMLREQKGKPIEISSSKDLNTLILNRMLSSKLATKLSKKPLFSSENLSEVGETIFSNILNGNFIGPLPLDEKKRPLYLVSDKEIETYAKLKKISGKLRKQDPKVQKLFSRFMIKNPDLEHNIVNAFLQLRGIQSFK